MGSGKNHRDLQVLRREAIWNTGVWSNHIEFQHTELRSCFSNPHLNENGEMGITRYLSASLLLKLKSKIS